MQPRDPNDREPSGVPEEVTAEARAAFGRRAPGEVATLVFDSLVDEDAPPSDHWLRFEHPRLQVELHIAAEADATTLTGRVTPASADRVELQLEDVDVSFVNDASGGGLHFKQVPHGLVRLWLIGVPGTPSIRTDWFRV